MTTNDVLDLFGDMGPEPDPVQIPKPTRRAKVRAVPEPQPIAPPTPAPPTPEPQEVGDPGFGPVFFDCGHLNWYRDEANETARAEGFCCEGGRKKVVVSLAHLKGQYVRPLPRNERRSPERERGMGFPGYCCDADGWYIGGIGNDCRYNSPDDRRCIVHGGPPPPVVYDDGESVDEEPPPPPEPAPMPKSSGSWKQRQMSAKRGRR